MALLEVDDVTLSFAGLTVLSEVSLTVDEGRIAGLIGPNGAGKSSLFNVVSGFYRPERGTVRLRGEPITQLPPHRISERGVARVFQHLALFEHLTVVDNLLVGRHHLVRTSWIGDLLWLPATRRQEARHRAKVEEVMDFLALERYRDLPVGILPYGVQKRVGLGRALCMEPALLLLDEPTAGLNQEETEDMARTLLEIRQELGVTQILIEHELRFVMDLADSVAVLDFGRKIAEGTPETIRSDRNVARAYTGAALPELA